MAENIGTLKEGNKLQLEDNKFLKEQLTARIEKNDSNKGVVINYLPKIEQKPFLDLCIPTNFKNPEVNRVSFYQWNFTFHICNVGNDITTKLYDRLFLIMFDLNGNPILDYLELVPGRSNISTTIHPNIEKKSFHFNDININSNFTFNNTRFYLYLSLDYANSIGIKIKPIKKIFQMYSVNQISEVTLTLMKISRTCV